MTRHAARPALALFLAAGAAGAGPDNPNVTAGSATFNTSGSTTTITAADGTVINYNSFNIGAHETVQFVQPHANATVLNRITGGSPTSIDGQLLANGRVYLVNPAGVMFGRNSVVNVGHLYAAAANISDADFLAGQNNFTGASGSVVNHGTISGSFVSLVGASVANYGTITADRGTVVMAAGNDIVISERLGQWHVRVERGGDADASGSTPPLAAGDQYTIAAWHDGTTVADEIIIASAGNTAVSGTFAASDPATGGRVTVSGTDVEIGNTHQNAKKNDTIVDEDTVEDALNAGLDFSIVADGTIILPFDVTIDKTEGGEATFTLNAADTITLDGSIHNSSGSALNLDLDAGNLVELFGGIDLGGGALSAVSRHITLGNVIEGEASKQGLGHRIGHEHDQGIGHDNHDESIYDHNHHKFHDEPGSLTIQAGVIELRGSESVAGTAVLVTTSTIADLSEAGFAALSDGLRTEMLGTPANQDFALLVTGELIDIAAPGWQTQNGGGMRLFSTGSITIDPDSSFVLDGRFIQEGPATLSLGGEITTTGDDILFASDTTLTGDLLLSANDGSGADALVGFAGTIDGDHFLSADAGQGRIIALQDLGSSEQLNNLRLRGRTIDLYGDATSRFQQVYVADTLTLHGSDLTTTDTSQPIGLERASIEVLAESGDSFSGNLVLDGDSVLRTAGVSEDGRSGTFQILDGDQVFVAGTTNAMNGVEASLTIDSGDAATVFGGSVGTGVGSGNELAMLDVTASEARLHGDVFTHGMNFFAPVAIHAENLTLHTGTGVALFADDVYSAEFEANSVSFQYSGDPTVDLGSNRTPFKFQGWIGARSSGYEPERSSESEYAFTNITFGDDRSPAAAASFLFGTYAEPGEALTPGHSLFDSFYVYAYDNITMGEGEKLTAFGTLELATGSESFGTVTIGDVNVLGDFYVSTQRLVFNTRAPGQVEGVGTEEDRIAGRTPELATDFGMEVIAAGSINLYVDEMLANGSGRVLALDSSGLTEFDGSGFGPVTQISGQDLEIPVVDSTLFESLLNGTPVRSAEGRPLYGYDLAVTAKPTIPTNEIDPNLALGFDGVDRFDPRYAGRYIPGGDVLRELALNPRAHDAAGHRSRATSGSGIISDLPGTPNPGVTDYTVTLDRLSVGAVRRLENVYVALFGEPVEEGSDIRSNTQDLHRQILNSWTSYRSAGGTDAMGFAGWAYQNDPAFFQTLVQIRELMDSLEALGLTPIDYARARARTLDRLRPGSLEIGAIDRMLRGLDQFVIPEPGTEGGANTNVASR